MKTLLIAGLLATGLSATGCHHILHDLTRVHVAHRRHVAGALVGAAVAGAVVHHAIHDVVHEAARPVVIVDHRRHRHTDACGCDRY